MKIAAGRFVLADPKGTPAVRSLDPAGVFLYASRLMGARKEAKAKGRTRYHGRPCRHSGHGTERKTANGECVVCWRLRKRRQPDYNHGSRRRKAKRNGFAPPPPEHLCPPRPEDGRCEYCGNDQGVLCLDHDHETGKFRGWLCHPCNLDDVLAGTEGIDIVVVAVVDEAGPESPECPSSTTTSS